MLYFNALLFIITFVGGSLPLWAKPIGERQMHLLLAFSGAFLLSITFLHLLPETFEELNHHAGLLILGGFFLQLVIQRFTHGIEHGHVHHHDHHHIALVPILAGLGLHAFMEGLPLGFNYRIGATTPSLYMAVAAHKLPEAMIAAMLVAGAKGKRTALIALFFFALITPIASVLATFAGTKYYAMSKLVAALIPVVAGAFIHIATTIFFESGTKQHLLTWRKIAAIIAGVGLGLATLVLE
jgi:zinc and cadmium transporter